jgi:hypothetical protein
MAHGTGNWELGSVQYKSDVQRKGRPLASSLGARKWHSLQVQIFRELASYPELNPLLVFPSLQLAMITLNAL